MAADDDQPETPDRRQLPTGLIPGRRTPEFTADTVPAGLLADHRTTVWARLEVSAGTVEFYEGDGPALTATPDRPIVILPNQAHRVRPSPAASFAVQFFEPEQKQPEH